MAITKRTVGHRQIGEGMHEDGGGFDVTVKSTVGSVRFGDREETPGIAAFRMIAEYDAEGDFQFPHPDKGYVNVKVEYTDD